jgi:hypothetical protein
MVNPQKQGKGMAKDMFKVRYEGYRNTRGKTFTGNWENRWE